MKTFSYLAAPARGKPQSGTIQAKDAAHAVDQLNSRGLTPLELNQGNKSSPWWNRDVKIFQGSAERRATLQFMEALSLLLRARVPVANAIKFAGSTNSSHSMRKSLEDVGRALNDGASLAEAVSEHMADLPASVRASLAVGERANDLVDTTATLANALRRSEARRKQISSALIYPAILAMLSLGLIAMLTFFLTPNLLPVFTATGAEIPFAIAALEAIRQWLSDLTNIPILLAFAVTAVFFVGWLTSTGKLRLAASRFPLFRQLRKLSLSYDFCTTCALMLGNGAVVSDALTVVRDGTRDRIASKELSDAIDEIAAGASLSSALHSQSWLDPSALALINSGEESNNLAEVMTIAATDLDVRATELTERMAAMLTPVLTIFLGLIVGTVIISTITGIMSINDLSI